MSASTSRLAGMFDEEPTPEEGAPVPTSTTPRPRPARQRSEAGKGRAKAAAQVQPPARAERKRDQGKRSDPDYRQVSLHMREATHFAAVDRLRHRREFADFGELVESLVADWLKGK